MKTAISIPDDLFHAAERAARRLGLSRSELYRTAVSAFLRSNDDLLITEAINSVYEDEPGRSQLDPVLERLQLASIAEDEW